MDGWGDKTGFVRELAAERGVSERTAWRWVAAAQATGTPKLPAQAERCLACDEALPKSTVRRRYCDHACRAWARRARLARRT